MTFPVLKFDRDSHATGGSELRSFGHKLFDFFGGFDLVVHYDMNKGWR
jgi:hypothetical protein